MDLAVSGYGYLIFGGTAGMGAAAAEILAAEGAGVALVGRDAGRATSAAERIGRDRPGSVHGLGGDLTQPGLADELVARAADLLGGLRGVIVTLGLGMRGQRDLAGATDDDWAATFDDVLLSVVRACRASVPALVAGGGGAIVTTAAYSVRAPKPHQFPYAALKSGVATFTKTLAKAHGADGIRANCVCPGAIETGVLAAMRDRIARERGWDREDALERVMRDEWDMSVALGRAGRADEVGDLLAFLVSERAGYLTGAVINIDGGTDF